MRAVLLLPVAAAVQVLETHQTPHAHVDYDGLKQTLKSIAAQRTDGNKIDYNSQQTVTRILTEIETTLLDALSVEASSSQEKLDNAVDRLLALNAMRSDYVNNETHGLPTYDAAVSQAKTTHDSCRASEQSECREWLDDCNAQDGVVAGINNAMCTTPDFSNGDSTAVNGFMNCMNGLVAQWYTDYTDSRRQCCESQSDCVSQTALCARAQADLEDKACDREKNVQMKCGEYRDNFKIAEEDYYSTLAAELKMQDILQTQREALACLQCYGRAILNNDTDLSSCDTPPACCTFDDCPIIRCPERDGVNCGQAPPVAFVQCTEPADHQPCDEPWTNANYGDWLNGQISRKGCNPDGEDSCVPRVEECGDCDCVHVQDDLTDSGATGLATFAPICG